MEVVQLVAVLVGSGMTLFKTIKFVQEGEMGIKLRFGRAVRNKDGSPKVIKPGFVLLIPWVETLQRHHVRQQTIRFDNQKIMTRDGLIFNISAVVMFRVRDIYRALFEIDNLDESISDLCVGILRDVVSARDHNQLSSAEEISNDLFKQSEVKTQEWGAELIQFKLIDCAPTPETAHLVVAAIGARLKAEAIQAAAKALGTSVGSLTPSLAAVLVGMPLVATAGDDHFTRARHENGRPVDDGEGDNQGQEERKAAINFSLFGNK